MQDARKQAYKLTEFILRHEREIRRAVYLERKYHDSGSHGDRVGRRSGISAPTECRALADLTPLKSVTIGKRSVVFWPEKWLDAIDRAGKDSGKIPRLFYAGISALELAKRFNVSKKTVYLEVSKFRGFVVEIALQYGLIKII